MVAKDNGALEFDLALEESVERSTARAAFDSARDTYREVLVKFSQASANA